MDVSSEMEVGEEFAVQALDSSGEIGIRDYDAQIQQRGALGDHADIDAFKPGWCLDSEKFRQGLLTQVTP